MAPSRNAEPVTDAAHGIDVHGMQWIRLDLAAQIRDVHIDDVIVVELGAPNPLQQLRAREHSAGLLGKRRQERELTRRQRQ